MAKRNMHETPEQVEEAAKDEAADKSLHRRFKIAHYAIAPARWMILGVCWVLRLEPDLNLREAGAPSYSDALEMAHQGRLDNIIMAFSILMQSVTHHDGEGGGYFTLPKNDVVGASHYANRLVRTSLSDEGKAELAAMLERRAARKTKEDSAPTNESGDADGPQV